MKFVAWAGSSVIKREALQRGLRTIKKMKWNVTAPSSLLKNATKGFNKHLPFLAANEATKIRELTKIIRNSKIDGVIATRGGYGCLRLLPLLDHSSLPRRHQFTIWGYSDLTILQLYFFSRFGWSYVQGPLIGSDSLARPTSEEKKAYKNFFKHGKLKEKFRLQLLAGSFQKNLTKSHLFLGGNLASIVSLLGTPWEPQPKKKFLLFLEDIEEPTYKLDRLLQQLGNSHFFDTCQGLVLGHFTNCKGYKECFSEFSKQFKVPVFEGLPMGHSSPRIPLLIGVPVKIEKSAKNLLLSYC